MYFEKKKKRNYRGWQGIALGASAAPGAVAAATAAPAATMSPRGRQIKEKSRNWNLENGFVFFEKIDLIAYTTFLETLKFNEV